MVCLQFLIGLKDQHAYCAVNLVFLLDMFHQLLLCLKIIETPSPWRLISTMSCFIFCLAFFGFFLLFLFPVSILLLFFLFYVLFYLVLFVLVLLTDMFVSLFLPGEQFLTLQTLDAVFLHLVVVKFFGDVEVCAAPTAPMMSCVMSMVCQSLWVAEGPFTLVTQIFVPRMFSGMAHQWMYFCKLCLAFAALVWFLLCGRCCFQVMLIYPVLLKLQDVSADECAHTTSENKLIPIMVSHVLITILLTIFTHLAAFCLTKELGGGGVWLVSVLLFDILGR